MSRLSDVLGGVYRDDDPAPNQHDSAALDVAPDVEDEAAAPVWEIDADDEPVTGMERPDEPSEDAPVWDLGSVVDDPAADWEPEAAPDAEPEPVQATTVEAAPTPVDSDWVDGDAVDDDEVPMWDPESVGTGSLDEVEVVTYESDPAPEAAVEAPPAPETTPEPELDADDDRGVTTASFGLLGDEDEEPVADLLGEGPWLRSDDDILPERRKRGFAFWRR